MRIFVVSALTVLSLISPHASADHFENENANFSAASLETGEIPFHEVMTRKIGPASKHPMHAFNVNHFEFSKADSETPDCKAMAKAHPCPEKMVFVCSKFFRTATCVDENLLNDNRTGKPKGNMNLGDCEAACKLQNKRLPTNNEWQVACAGTEPTACLTYKGEYPPIHFSKIKGHVCQTTGPYNDPCMTSPDLVALLPRTPQACVSEAGVRGCVGTFEQWVSNAFVAHKFYRFNGGMYALDASAVDYVTPGHDSSYRHYAGGCRCASDP